MSNDAIVRQQLVNMLNVRQAHMLLDDAVKNFPMAHINTRPTNVEYSFWHLLEHIRFTQYDILDYIVNANYHYHDWPKDYWQAIDATTDAAGWNKTIQQFHDDLNQLVSIVMNPKTDIYAQIPHGEKGHTIVREINVVSTHNAYHIGEFGILRQVMKLW